MNFIFELLVEIFIEIIFDGIILGFFRLILKGYKYLKHKIFNTPLKEKPKDPVKEAENKFLYKLIVLTENVNPILKYGQRGMLIEIVDTKQVCAEFFNKDDKRIEYENNSLFKIRTNQFKLYSKKLTTES